MPVEVDGVVNTDTIGTVESEFCNARIENSSATDRAFERGGVNFLALFVNIHEIDSCSLNKYIEIDYECSGSSPEYAQADCYIFEDDTLKTYVYELCEDCDEVKTAPAAVTY